MRETLQEMRAGSFEVRPAEKSGRLAAPSIVLEWETVLEGGVERAVRGLSEVCRQIMELRDELRAPAEVIVAYECTIAEVELRAVIARAARGRGWPCAVVYVAVPEGTPYYEKKNLGARAARNEILVFLDTDLVPEAGWLRALLGTFDDWSRSVVFGATHLDHGSMYEMAVALFWIFMPATQGRGLQPLRRYSSNNLAFRRPVFERFPFPTLPTYRGQCSALGETLLQAGIPIVEHTDARATHPPPPGAWCFVHRAWAAGQDEHFYAAREAAPGLAKWAWQVRRDYRAVAQRIRERRTVLRPSLAAAGLGWVLGWVYYGVKAVGYAAAVLQRHFIPAGERRVAWALRARRSATRRTC